MDEKGRIRSDAWVAEYYPNKWVPVLGLGAYVKQGILGDTHSKNIRDQKHHKNLAKIFIPRTIEAIDDYKHHDFNFAEFDVVVPIPSRTNLFELRPTVCTVAQEIAKHLQVRCAYALKRKQRMAKSGLSTKAKYEATKDAFFCDDPQLLGKNVILIDDVKTSGCTILACEKLLQQRGVKKIVGICFGVQERPEFIEEIQKILRGGNKWV